MAKQIIILERTDEPSDLNFNVVFWPVVPSARVAFYADALKTSRFKDISAQELTDLRAGSFIEIYEKVSFIAGTTLNNIRVDLAARFNRHQNDLNNQNPFVRYGTFYDGSSWTAGGVA